MYGRRLAGFVGVFKTASNRRHCRRRRHNNAGQRKVQAALLPFYFAVHPDRFARHPLLQRTNEQSLQKLHGFLAEDEAQRTAVDLKFYLREEGRNDVADVMKRIELRMVAVDPLAAVRQLLELCNLSTEELPRREGGTQFVEEELAVFLRNSRRRTRPTSHYAGLRDAVCRLAGESRNLRRRYFAVKKELRPLVERVKALTGAGDVLWDTDWSISLMGGCLGALLRLVDTGGRTRLNGRAVKFSRDLFTSYVSSDGTIVLAADDVAEKWISLLVRCQAHRNQLHLVGIMENRLSNLLGGAVILRYSRLPLGAYKARLRAIVDGLEKVGRLDTHKLGQTSSPTCKTLVRISCENANSACGLDEELGLVLFSADCRTEDLVKFFLANAHLARAARWKYDRTAGLVSTVHAAAMRGGNFESVSWDEGVRVADLLDCLERLEQASPLLRPDEEDSGDCQTLALHINNSAARYSLLSDGRLSIPVQWSM